MASILIGIFTILLLLLCAFIVLVILMQRPSANSGMGSALGGGAAESAFGAQTGNVLTRVTIYGAVGFFVLCLGLYLAQMSQIETNGKTSAKYHAEVKALTEAKAKEDEAKAKADKAASLGTLTQPTVDSTKTQEPAKTSTSPDAKSAPATNVETPQPSQPQPAPEKKAEGSM